MSVKSPEAHVGAHGSRHGGVGRGAYGGRVAGWRGVPRMQMLVRSTCVVYLSRANGGAGWDRIGLTRSQKASAAFTSTGSHSWATIVTGGISRGRMVWWCAAGDGRSQRALAFHGHCGSCVLVWRFLAAAEYQSGRLGTETADGQEEMRDRWPMRVVGTGGAMWASSVCRARRKRASARQTGTVGEAEKSGSCRPRYEPHGTVQC